jgi:hypothetical protein
MTRERLFGSDVPFMNWCRNSKALPSWSDTCGWVQTDVDTFVHRYLTCVDGLGTREIQVMMEVEVKTRSGSLTPSQQDTYFKKHLMINKQKTWKGQTLIHHGITVLIMSGTTPDDSSSLVWCRFDEKGNLRKNQITSRQLISLLKFECDPDSLKPTSFRRHHAVKSYLVAEKTPLGFVTERKLIKRS